MRWIKRWATRPPTPASRLLVSQPDVYELDDYLGQPTEVEPGVAQTIVPDGPRACLIPDYGTIFGWPTFDLDAVIPASCTHDRPR